MKSNVVQENEAEIFTFNEILIYSFSFLFLFFGLNFIFQYLSDVYNYPIAITWPIFVIEVKQPGVLEYFLAGIIFTICISEVKLVCGYSLHRRWIILMGLNLIIITNLIYGIYNGLVRPITDTGTQLYHDALCVDDPILFLQNYEKIQPNLKIHGKTHPPGAVLFFYILKLFLKEPYLISLTICLISTVLSGLFLNGILKRQLDKNTANYITFLFFLLPSVQIFYLANIYAIVCSLMLGVVYFYFSDNKYANIFGSLIFLFFIAFITFMFVFIIFTLIIYEIYQSKMHKSGKNLLKLTSILLSLIFLYFLIYILFGFNYLNSFIIASYLENPEGFRLFANPIDYFFTRMEDILEIIVFFGPFLIGLFIRAVRSKDNNFLNWFRLSYSALITLFIFFILGVYKTGETARACIYIYPFLLLPIAIFFKNQQFPNSEKENLLLLIFAQSIIMQLFGYYIW
ncbi:MAG: hypothetical protein ACP6IY_16040 [Promethearchaeia archaeon]